MDNNLIANKLNKYFNCILLIFCSLFLFITCDDVSFEDGVYFAYVNNHELMDEAFVFNKSTIDDFGTFHKLDSISVNKLNSLNNVKYRENHDMISCYVNGCFFIVKNHKIEKKLFVGCNYCTFNFMTLTKSGRDLLDSILVTIPN